MNCNAILEGFSDYEDGTLDADARSRVDAHLEVCASCRRYVEVIRKGRGLLTLLPPVEVGEDFSPRLQHRLYHVDDGESLIRERDSASGTTAVTALAMAVLLALAAWSPSVRRPMVVELPAIVVNEPPLRPARLIYQTTPVRTTPSDPHVRSLWTVANDLLHTTSPLHERTRNRPTQAGVQ